MEMLGGWIGSGPIRAAQVLDGAPLTAEELSRAADVCRITEEELAYSDLLETAERSVLVENIDYLFGTLVHGQLGQFAADIDVNRATVSNWRAGRQRPHQEHLLLIKRYFGLPDETNLEEDPVFLSVAPVGEVAMRRWLRERVEQISRKELQLMFPALQKLLDVA